MANAFKRHRPHLLILRIKALRQHCKYFNWYAIQRSITTDLVNKLIVGEIITANPFLGRSDGHAHPSPLMSPTMGQTHHTGHHLITGQRLCHHLANTGLNTHLGLIL